MIAYLDCFSGISGDMLLGALVDAGLALADLRADLSRLPLHGYDITAEKVSKQGIAGTLVRVRADHSHAHRGLHDILDIIGRAELPPEVVGPAKRAFERLAAAEARVHSTTVDEVHFHEVGAVDAIVDIVGAFCGLHRLGIEQVYASPLPLGGGWVDTAHGRLPVPAPATVELLRGVASYGGPVEAELVTPTGAAILTTVCRDFGDMPPMTIRATGWGAGSKDLPHPNLLRLFLGDEVKRPQERRLVLIETNIDDMNPELFGHVMERLLEAGALDVFYTPIVMKKSRPATLVSVLSEPPLVDTLSDILFRETTTLGIRLTDVARRCLDREWREVQTEYGKVRVKIGRLGDQTLTIAPEYEDCVRLAREKGVPATLVYDAARRAAL
ncbi:MAG: nickel pincer cofactor biosynthesis protein LarC [Armatimonadota bacterium]